MQRTENEKADTIFRRRIEIRLHGHDAIGTS